MLYPSLTNIESTVRYQPRFSFLSYSITPFLNFVALHFGTRDFKPAKLGSDILPQSFDHKSNSSSLSACAAASSSSSSKTKYGLCSTGRNRYPVNT